MNNEAKAQVFVGLYQSALSLFVGASVSASVYHVLRWFGVEPREAGVITVCGMMFACATSYGHVLGVAADSFHPKLDDIALHIQDIERNTRP